MMVKSQAAVRGLQTLLPAVLLAAAALLLQEGACHQQQLAAPEPFALEDIDSAAQSTLTKCKRPTNFHFCSHFNGALLSDKEDRAGIVDDSARQAFEGWANSDLPEETFLPLKRVFCAVVAESMSVKPCAHNDGQSSLPAAAAAISSDREDTNILHTDGNAVSSTSMINPASKHGGHAGISGTWDIDLLDEHGMGSRISFFPAFPPETLERVPPGRDIAADPLGAKVAYFLMLSHSDSLEQIERFISRVAHPRHILLVHISGSRFLQNQVRRIISKISRELEVVWPPHLWGSWVYDFLPTHFTAWGHWSLVHLEVHALSILAKMGDWDYYINLSGTHYPLLHPMQIAMTLAHRVHSISLPPNFVEVDMGGQEYWEKDRIGQIQVSCIDFGLSCSRTFGLPFHRDYRGQFKYFKGSQWHMLSRGFVDYVVDPESPRMKFWIQFMRTTWIPDEGLFQTILLNSPFAPTHRNQLVTFLEFLPGDFHPRYMRLADYSMLAHNDAFFMRKVHPSRSRGIMDALDRRQQFIAETTISATDPFQRKSFPSDHPLFAFPKEVILDTSLGSPSFQRDLMLAIDGSWHHAGELFSETAMTLLFLKVYSSVFAGMYAKEATVQQAGVEFSGINGVACRSWKSPDCIQHFPDQVFKGRLFAEAIMAYSSSLPLSPDSEPEYLSGYIVQVRYQSRTSDIRLRFNWAILWEAARIPGGIARNAVPSSRPAALVVYPAGDDLHLNHLSNFQLHRITYPVVLRHKENASLTRDHRKYRQRY